MHRVETYGWATAVALGAAAIVGCGGSGGSSQRAESTTPVEQAPPPQPVGPVSARGSEEVHARVGRAGGTLELANGCRLEVASGALSQELELTFRDAAEAREAWDDETKRALGPIVEATPAIDDGGDQHAFSISCPRQSIPQGFEPGDLALGREEPADRGRALSMGGTRMRWQFWPARVEGERFVADLPGLPGNRLQFGVSQ